MSGTPDGRRRTPEQRKRDRQRAEAQPQADAAEPVAGEVVDEAAPGPTREERLAALAAVQWSLKGRFTLALVMAVLLVPFAILTYLPSDRTYSFAAYLVVLMAPSQLIPLPLLLAGFAGMPLARALAGEPRSLRILETLGFIAVVDIVAIGVWGAMPKSSASYHDGKVIAAGALADVVALVAGAYAYGPISRRLSPGRRMRRR